jgi:hypothetical protein
MNDTYLQRQQNEIDESGGRYSKLGPRTIVGATHSPTYPRAADWCSSAAAVPDEEPLGYSVEDHPSTGEPFEIEQSLRAQSCHPEPEAPFAAPVGPSVDAAKGRPTIRRRI